MVVRLGLLMSLLVMVSCVPAASVKSDPAAGLPDSRMDIPYRDSIGDSQVGQLDIYRADGLHKAPVLIFVHGGSWKGGDKSNLNGFAKGFTRFFASRGTVVVAPNFRLAGSLYGGRPATWRDQCNDIAEAIAWVRRNAARYGADPDRIVIFGYSSGAHLSAMLTANPEFLALAGVPAESIRGAVLFDVHAYDVPFAIEIMKGSVVEKNIPHMQAIFGVDRQSQEAGSPAHFIGSGKIVPTLIVSSGRTDQPGAFGQVSGRASARYRDALNAAGGSATAFHFENETHFSLMSDFGLPGDGPTSQVIKFLDGLSRPN